MCTKRNFAKYLFILFFAFFGGTILFVFDIIHYIFIQPVQLFLSNFPLPQDDETITPPVDNQEIGTNFGWISMSLVCEECKELNQICMHRSEKKVTEME